MLVDWPGLGCIGRTAHVQLIRSYPVIHSHIRYYGNKYANKRQEKNHPKVTSS
jgi:hypothetical protein